MHSQMPDQSKHRLYRLLVRLYPKAHRQEYGEQMIQTFDDILCDSHTTTERFDVWLRIAKELPANLTEEHITNLKNMQTGVVMSNIGKRKISIVTAVVLVVMSAGVIVALTRQQQFSPVTLSVARNSGDGTACIQKQKNAKLTVSKQDADYVGNAAALSIIDIPAGTNVDVHLKTFSSTAATGTAVYDGTYGSYNFVATKTAASDGFTNGWQINEFKACK